jgi:hypothetical protein
MSAAEKNGSDIEMVRVLKDIVSARLQVAPGSATVAVKL